MMSSWLVSWVWVKPKRSRQMVVLSVPVLPAPK
jgi:hypothetical protein